MAHDTTASTTLWRSLGGCREDCKTSSVSSPWEHTPFLRGLLYGAASDRGCHEFSSSIADPDFQHVPMNTYEHLQKLQLLVQKFWKHWQKEYLQEMQKVPRSNARADDIQPGRMVIVVDELLPTTRWPLARITDTHPGLDGLVRVVTLRTAKGTI